MLRVMAINFVMKQLLLISFFLTAGLISIGQSKTSGQAGSIPSKKAVSTKGSTTAPKGSTSNKTIGTKASAKNQVPKVELAGIHYWDAKAKAMLLRWAPTNELGWRMLQQYGVVLERIQIRNKGQALSRSEAARSFFSVKLEKDSIHYFIQFGKFNDNAAVMGQVLYGEDFELTLSSKGKDSAKSGAEIFSRSEILNQKFAFAMFAAENDFLVSTMAALGFSDTAAKLGNEYLYRIYADVPKSKGLSDTVMILANTLDQFPIPKPSSIQAESSSSSIQLRWDSERTKNFYSNFFVQRSNDSGKTFIPIHYKPIGSFNQNSEPIFQGMTFFEDTAVKVGQTYQYRLVAKTPFGTLSPWSDTVSVALKPFLEGVPGISGIIFGPKKEWILSFEFEDSIRSKLKDFDLLFSKVSTGPYDTLIKNIDRLSKFVVLPDSLPTSYLVMKANSLENVSRTSFPFLIQKDDSIPPLKPVGLQGMIDSSGIVKFFWNPNSESDLRGYKVYRTFVKGQEFVDISNLVIANSKWTDTVDMSSLNGYVYYSVAAVDFRYNESPMSDVLILKKPDLIPPSPPVFSNYEFKEDALHVSVIAPSEADVKKITLQRKDNFGSWKTIDSSVVSKTIVLKDLSMQPDIQYQYKIFAYDSAENRSVDAQILTVILPKKSTLLPINKLEGKVDREKRLIYLTWLLPNDSKIKSLELFRGKDDEGVQLFKVLPGNTRDFLDSELQVNTKYKYAIRVIYEGGQFSSFVSKNINY